VRDDKKREELEKELLAEAFDEYLDNSEFDELLPDEDN